MARSNGSNTINHWAKVSPQLPYRASIDGNANWNVDKPSPYLAGAMRVSPGGRLMLAFALEDLRTYFVEGHSHQGAQPEPDFADRARRRQVVQELSQVEDWTLEATIDHFRNALANQRRSEETLRVAFVLNAEQLIASGEVVSAAEIINSMPSSMMKSVAISRLIDSGLWDTATHRLSDYLAADLTPERAAAMLQHLRAQIALHELQPTLANKVDAQVEDFVSRGDLDAFEVFLQSFPGSVEKAFLSDRLDQARLHASYTSKM